ncbi:MAG: DEAD/DEAH box helicase [Desulfobacteraceae bacterium]|nr:DEAD/DEAH box helicase [Desulfobacteraceae bacterium]
MTPINRAFIKNKVADSLPIYKRGIHLYENGAFSLREANPELKSFVFDVDGNYGDYITRIELNDGQLKTACDCPYPGNGCKHIVAAMLSVLSLTPKRQAADKSVDADVENGSRCLTPEEIKQQAVEDRIRRSKTEDLIFTQGDMIKGEHLVETSNGRQYTVILHDPVHTTGHCDCPDYATNRLGLCKHLLFASAQLKKKRGFAKQLEKEIFPFIDLYWDSKKQQPRLFHEKHRPQDLKETLDCLFDINGDMKGEEITDLLLLLKQQHNKHLRISSEVMRRVELRFQMQQFVEDSSSRDTIKGLNIKAQLYPYQEEGVRFGLHKPATLIGDEMGLGKTLQAIALAILKRKVFGFHKVLVVTLASLKDQWQREIHHFSSEKALVIAGSPKQRIGQYLKDDTYFKITNYEAVLRDTLVLSRFKPDLVILDEAQRIKNFSTKTAAAVKQIPRTHALVLTGTPLENKLEDVYSIVQFLDPYLLSPLWQFAADHFMLSREKKGAILGYTNLDRLQTKLAPLVIRRKKDEVLKDLPDQVVNTYYIDLHIKQQRLHAGYSQALAPLLSKKHLTPMDLRHIQELLLRMRQTCNSTYLIDRKTNISPKLKELAGIIDDIAIQDNRKMVIFSEWTTMTYLIARHLSDAGVNFVELSGKIPVKKRQALIDEFTNNPDCLVFLSTDAGGTGLNLQAADCVVNFEIPWNPAKLNQRIGRVNRIGQKSRCVNVINLIAKNSIEERILAGIQLKTDLFDGVFDDGPATVEFSQEKRNELLNRLREMIEEEPLPAPSENIQEELSEDTPHYLNPQVLNQPEHQSIDFTAEEEIADNLSSTSITATGVSAAQVDETATPFPGQSPEKMEMVLNNGFQFLTGMIEMATGQKIESKGEDQRMVQLDPRTGEVTLKFKLPGFGG